MDSRGMSERPVELWATVSRNKVEKGMSKNAAILGLNDLNECWRQNRSIRKLI